MCFCHSILTFKIIFVFKIMIVIRFRIWFLIKFKLQRREWVWLKRCFSHAKGLWHYKYRSQCMHKGGDDMDKKTEKKRKTEKKNREEKQGRRQKWENRGENKKKTKNRGRRDWKKEEKESILQPVPALLPSPSLSASPGKVFLVIVARKQCEGHLHCATHTWVEPRMPAAQPGH